jgi:triphosphoribosyl-dephospho-CoA synthase
MVKNMSISRVDVGRAAQAACLLEASSPKPGNVNRYFDFSDTTLEDFMMSAVMIGRAMQRAHLTSVGKTVQQTVRDTRSMVPRNTNLGIILLFAPLAKAVHEAGDLRSSIQNVLGALTVEDARDVYRAIRLAAPGGLGKVSVYDVEDHVDITLLESMNLAQDRDAVAKEYVTNFAITFELACPSLETFLKEGYDFPAAVVQLYLTILAEVPDTLIARKRGFQVALGVSHRAAMVLKAGGISSPAGREELKKFDGTLRSQENTLNPGTTADLTAAAIFTYLLQNGLNIWHKVRK